MACCYCVALICMAIWMSWIFYLSILIRSPFSSTLGLTCVNCQRRFRPFWDLADFIPLWTPAGNRRAGGKSPQGVDASSSLPVGDGLAALWLVPTLKATAGFQQPGNHFLCWSLQADHANGSLRRCCTILVGFLSSCPSLYKWSICYILFSNRTVTLLYLSATGPLIRQDQGAFVSLPHLPFGLLQEVDKELEAPWDKHCK